MSSSDAVVAQSAFGALRIGGWWTLCFVFRVEFCDPLILSCRSITTVHLCEVVPSPKFHALKLLDTRICTRQQTILLWSGSSPPQTTIDASWTMLPVINLQKFMLRKFDHFQALTLAFSQYGSVLGMVDGRLVILNTTRDVKQHISILLAYQRPQHSPRYLQSLFLV